jgi:hypothetical protein
MAGLSTDRGSLDLVMGQAILNLRMALDEVARINTMLQNDPRYSDANMTADIQSGGYGYTATEMLSIKPAFFSLSKLRDIAHAQATQSPADNFFFWANNLTGVR